MPPSTKPAPPQQSSLMEMWAGKNKKVKGKEKEEPKEDASQIQKNGADDKMNIDGTHNTCYL